MIRKWFVSLALVVIVGTFLTLASCGREQQLVSIQVQPSSETFGASNIPLSVDAGAQVQLRALGTYIHPPVTKDITSQVTWNSNTPQMMTVDANGLVTVTGLACGSTLISATVTTNKSAGGIGSSGALVTGYMTGSVVCFTGTSGGGGSGPSVTVNFAGTGSGTVSSNPAGLSCASGTTCFSNSFPSGTNVSITAAPNGTFGGWGGCDSVDGTGLICTLDDLTAARTVSATFN